MSKKISLSFFGVTVVGLIYAIVKVWSISANVAGILFGTLILLIIGLVLAIKENKTV